MGSRVPLPPWATREQIEARLRYYRLQAVFMLIVCGAAVLLLIALSMLVLLR